MPRGLAANDRAGMLVARGGDHSPSPVVMWTFAGERKHPKSPMFQHARSAGEAPKPPCGVLTRDRWPVMSGSASRSAANPNMDGDDADILCVIASVRRSGLTLKPEVGVVEIQVWPHVLNGVCRRDHIECRDENIAWLQSKGSDSWRGCNEVVQEVVAISGPPVNQRTCPRTHLTYGPWTSQPVSEAGRSRDHLPRHRYGFTVIRMGSATNSCQTQRMSIRRCRSRC